MQFKRSKNNVKKILEGAGINSSPKKNNECSYGNCSNKYYAKGYCANHYRKFLKTGNPSPHIPNGKSTDKDGYVVCNKNGNKWFEHRKLMEDFLGRKLFREEKVIHVNGNRSDNRIENLKIKRQRDLINEVILKYINGENAVKIADFYNITSTTVYNWLEENNIERRKQERKYRDLIADLRSWSYYNWRPNVFRRDNYTCQECGDNKGGNLNAHHVVQFSTVLKKLGKIGKTIWILLKKNLNFLTMSLKILLLKILTMELLYVKNVI